MDEYRRLGTAAVLAFQQGRHREAADFYLRSFMASPEPWADNRWQIFSGYTSLLSDKFFQPRPSDFDALDRVMNDRAEIRLFRAEAAWTKGFLTWWAKRDSSDAAEHYREAIRLGAKAKSQERQKRIMATIPSEDGNAVAGIGFRSVGDILDDILVKVKRNLSDLEHARVLHSGRSQAEINTARSQQFVRSDGVTQLPSEGRRTKISFGPLPRRLTDEHAQKLLTVGGDKCDYCGKTRDELRVSALQKCTRCERAFYCSRECQKAQWKAGHKQHCRKQGEIKVGDYLRVHGIQSRPEINGEVVEIIAPVPDSDRWETRIPGGDRSISLAPKNLERLRPLL